MIRSGFSKCMFVVRHDPQLFAIQQEDLATDRLAIAGLGPSRNPHSWESLQLKGSSAFPNPTDAKFQISTKNHLQKPKPIREVIVYIHIQLSTQHLQGYPYFCSTQLLRLL